MQILVVILYVVHAILQIQHQFEVEHTCRQKEAEYKKIRCLNTKLDSPLEKELHLEEDDKNALLGSEHLHRTGVDC